jgi:thiamine kinase-like enzyme
MTDDTWLCCNIEEAYFIDYEYGCYAFRGFDIGNHFNEHCGFECDYSKYPNKAFQLQWLEWYLQAANDDGGKTVLGLCRNDGMLKDRRFMSF